MTDPRNGPSGRRILDLDVGELGRVTGRLPEPRELPDRDFELLVLREPEVERVVRHFRRHVVTATWVSPFSVPTGAAGV